VATSAHDVTQLLHAWSGGDHGALEKLAPLVYAELRRLAKRYMRREPPGHVLQTTALVNEAYIRLVDVTGVGWRDRTHFFAVSARIMRHILVDLARSRRNLKHGGKLRLVPLNEASAAVEASHPDLLALDEALTALELTDPRKSRVVELRYFGGLSVKETADVLAVSPDTVMRDWRLAKLWLLRELERGSPS
jgi:RNA polymerase sigma factor (TIGR02999 family)